MIECSTFLSLMEMFLDRNPDLIVVDANNEFDEHMREAVKHSMAAFDPFRDNLEKTAEQYANMLREEEYLEDEKKREIVERLLDDVRR